jgi:hypothetical protein
MFGMIKTGASQGAGAAVCDTEEKSQISSVIELLYGISTSTHIFILNLFFQLFYEEVVAGKLLLFLGQLLEQSGWGQQFC